MFTGTCWKRLSLLYFICFAGTLWSQTGYSFSISKTVEQCSNANASLDITGGAATDTVTINWSTGQNNTRNIYDLTAGDYSVLVTVKYRKDTVIATRDTAVVRVTSETISFTVDKEQCVVSMPKYFSPNGDNYSDVLRIINIDKYPDFEFSVFNKWGQRVHHQKAAYTPWDGTWLGVDLPDATYYYVFFYESTNRHKFVKGDITILR